MPDGTISLRHAPSGVAPADHDTWVKNLQDWAHQLTVLKVITYVGDAALTTDADGLPASLTVAPQGAAFVTVCDLVGGDMTNVIPSQFKDDDALRSFHTQQVAAAAEVLPNNLRVLGELVEKIFRG